ncbi:MAG: hypothetical protein KDK70_35940, partial [Myxococcales bacterium]|nr:hypothetical protein [Myxococcales bacterium]
MWARGHARGFALVCLLVGCGDDGGSAETGTTSGSDGTESSSGSEVMNAAPTVVAEVDVAAACVTSD